MGYGDEKIFVAFRGEKLLDLSILKIKVKSNYFYFFF